MGRRLQAMILAGAATVALVGTPAPAPAQETTIDEEGRRAQRRLRGIRQLEGFLAEAEVARLAGRCDTVRAWHTFFHGTNPNFTIAETVPAELRETFRRRIDEIAALECPPGSGTPSVAPPTPAAPAPGSAGTIRIDLPPPSEGTGIDDCAPVARPEDATPGCPDRRPEEESILDETADDVSSTAPDGAPTPAAHPDASHPSFIRGQMSVALQACNRERFEELKRRLIARLGQLLNQATDAFTRGRLQRELEMAQAATMPVPCPPERRVTVPGETTGPGAPTGTVGSTGGSAAPEPRRTPPPVPPSQPQPPPPPRPVAGPPASQALSDPPFNPGEYATAANPDDSEITTTFVAIFGRAEIPATGIGVTRSGPAGAAPETDAGPTGDRVSTIGFEGALRLGNIRLRAGYIEGDARTAFDRQPIAGGFNGAVFGALSPAGSSGTGAGSVTLAGTTEVDLSRFRLGGDLSIAQPNPRTRVYFSFDYFRDVRNYDLSLTGTVGAVQFTQERDQRIVDNAFGAGFGVETRVPLGEALSLRARAAVQAYVLDSNLRSFERNISNFGPAPDRDFTIEIDEGDTDFGVAADAAAELDYALSPGLSIFAGGAVRYRSRVSGVFNPNSGDQVFFDGRTTALTSDDFWSYGARVGIRVALGRR